MLTLGVFAGDTAQDAGSLAVLGHDAAEEAQGHGEVGQGSRDTHLDGEKGSSNLSVIEERYGMIVQR